MTDAELDLLVGTLEREALPGAHLELGTAAGGTLCRMLACLPEARGFVVVDRLEYFEGQRETLYENLARHEIDSARVDLRAVNSRKGFAASAKLGERFDFMLIDAGHKLIDVTLDLRWTRLLNEGGIVCLHDYDDRWSHRGVRVAVDRFERRHPEYERVGLADTLVVLRKVRAARRPEVDALDLLHAATLWLPLRIGRTAGKLAKRWRRRRRRRRGSRG
jgi:predicted O-methyltransferase YrrM